MGKASKGLLDDGDDHNDFEGTDVNLRIDLEYAARLEHNKQREEWHRLKEKNPRLAAKLEAKVTGADLSEGETDEGSSDDEDDDEEEEAAEQARIDEHFLSVLSKIRQKDQSIYDSTAQLYPEPESDSESENGPPDRTKPSQKARLKDVLAKQALEGHEGSSSDDEDMAPHKSQGPTYVQEQQQLRQAFLREVEKAEVGEGEDDFGGVLKPRQRAADLGDSAERGGDPESTQKLLDDYFGADDAQLGEEDKFLKRFIANKGWLDREDEGFQQYGSQDEEDEEYIERAERFESEYNHRFEEPGGSNIATYPRVLEGVVRKKNDRRKAQREAAAKRKADEAAAMGEQVKRLKSAKRREIDERLDRIKAASGSEVAERLLKGIMGKADFDLEEYDKAMAAAFDDEYYEEQDPDLDDEDADHDEDAPLALESLPEIDDIEEENDEPTGNIDVGAEKAQLSKLADEYNAMDAEDTVGGVRTRFRYREVPAVDYGLKILDILCAPEKELNQVVGMKRLAPYREDAGRFRPNMAKLREMQSAVGRSGREKKVPLQRQTFEREQHGTREPGHGNAQAPSDGKLAAPSQATPQKQKHAGTEKLRKGPSRDRALQGEAAAGHAQALAGDGGAKVQRKQRHVSDQGEPGRGKVSKKRQHASEQAAAVDGEQTAHQQKKRRRPHQESRSIREQTAEERAQSRLASFAKPTLTGPSSASQVGKKKKREQQEAGEAAAHEEEPSGPSLTKAQKKNLWRAKRRAMQHKQPAVPAHAL